jgi:hypothetical protein
MARRCATRPDHPDPDTANGLARRYRVAPRVIRQAIKKGELPAYYMGTSWPRVFDSDFKAWIRSTRVPVTSHARARVAELLEQEGA